MLLSLSIFVQAWTLKECKVAALGFNQAIQEIVINKVQKGIRPTKVEACHLPNIAKSYLDRCSNYDNKKNIDLIKKSYYTYQYACDNWVE